jgi:ribosomal protein S18 acetylase RimI-like enzyme
MSSSCSPPVAGCCRRSAIEHLPVAPVSGEIRLLAAGDEDAVLAARALFDHEPDIDATRRFLAEPTHHLLVAYDAAGEPLGFVTGVELTHPDKGTEMFLYELGVDEAHRNHGVGRDLAGALAALARDRGCYGMWVLTDDDNPAALRAYAAAGATPEDNTRLLAWDLTS